MRFVPQTSRAYIVPRIPASSPSFPLVRDMIPPRPLIVALNGAGVIPAEEAQDMGRVLREDRLTTTWCKLETKWAGRLYMGGHEVRRVGTKPEDIRSV